jgi:TRAP-type C4-dicarboxylate transport system permease large subunit
VILKGDKAEGGRFVHHYASKKLTKKITDKLLSNLITLSEISLLTPPVGMNLYIVNGVTKVPLEKVIRGIIPFLIMLYIRLGIIIAFPEVSLFLPKLMK